MMKTIAKIVITAIALTLVSFAASWAQEIVVVMTTGERFVSSKVWEEDGKIRFNMQGLVVSVNQEQVAAILRDDGERPSPVDNHKPGPSPEVDARPPPSPAPSLSNQSVAPTPMTPKNPMPPSGHSSTFTPPVFDDIGLNGLVWRMPSEQIPGLEKIETDPAFGGIDQHWRPDQPLVFEEALLDGLVFGFWHNQLYSIVMWAEGRIGYNRLRNTVFDRFGRGRQSSPNVDRYVWAGPETQRMLEFDEDTKTGLFIMRSSALHAQIRQRYPD